jgi:inosine-uridine nucleoside N-ribohydrolase
MIKSFLLLAIFIGQSTIALMGQAPPVSVIFDTDIAPDYDDVGALAILHAMADRGEARILATISSNAFETTAPTLSVLNTYFGRPGIPVGVTKNHAPYKACSQQWAEAIILKYPHAIRSNADAWDAVELYRKILSAVPDHSVTIISTGFFTNLAGLLQSRPDNYSSLPGRELVARKVRILVSMAARLDSGSTGGYEFNVMVDPPSSRKVFQDWPGDFVLSGFEIGEKILTGIRLIHNESIQNSPVKDAFRIALDKDGNTKGRNSWDETAVLVGVRGITPWFGFNRLNFSVSDDGRNNLIPGERFIYLAFRQTPEQIGSQLEDLMMHQPAGTLHKVAN